MIPQDVPTDAQDVARASAALAPWLEGAQALVLLQGALAAGIVQAARGPRTPADLAADTRLDVRRVEAVCLALEAHGIFVREATTDRLADAWRALASTAALPLLRPRVEAMPAVTRALVAAVTSDASYWTTATADRLALAQWVTLDPTSPLTPRLLVDALVAVPEVIARLEAGGRWVEFGCGVCGGLLSMLQAYPRATALGVDLDAEVLAIAASRAVRLGVQARLELRQADAGTLEEEASADVLFWSQFFFPAASRVAVLRAAFRALKPGGLLLATLLSEAPASPAESQPPTGREHAIDHVLYGS